MKKTPLYKHAYEAAQATGVEMSHKYYEFVTLCGWYWDRSLEKSVQCFRLYLKVFYLMVEKRTLF